MTKTGETAGSSAEELEPQKEVAAESRFFGKLDMDGPMSMAKKRSVQASSLSNVLSAFFV